MRCTQRYAVRRVGFPVIFGESIRAGPHWETFPVFAASVICQRHPMRFSWQCRVLPLSTWLHNWQRLGQVGWSVTPQGSAS